jgi:eukaryotic translation initiation factor 2C
MEGCTVRLLKAFALANNGNYPTRIVMFRDGVGEGFFDGILGYELQCMRLACTRLRPDYSPKITFLIVQKRNHVRLFPGECKSNSKEDFDRNGNCLSGMVVDTKIVSPVDHDFFLVSHGHLHNC